MQAGLQLNFMCDFIFLSYIIFIIIIFLHKVFSDTGSAF